MNNHIVDTPRGRLLTMALAILLPLGYTFPAQALLTLENAAKTTSLDLGLHARLNSLAMRRPQLQPLYLDRNLAYGQATTRLLLDLVIGDHVAAEANALLDVSTATTPLSQFQGMFGVAGSSAESFRSAALAKDMVSKDKFLLHGEIDRLNLRLTFGPLGIKLGRQAVDTATCFYFTPNDIFQPFNASAIYRAYKPGVDAARFDLSTDSLSGVSAIVALGYRDDKAPHLADTSFMLRLFTTAFRFEWSLIFARTADALRVGGALQGEFEGVAMGVRAEGHAFIPYDGARGYGQPIAELAVGADYRFENTLHLKAEYFFHGRGLTGDDYYPAVLDYTGGAYLGRHYAAFGAGYELHALVNLEWFILANLGDPSAYTALFSQISVSDDLDMLVGLFAAFGERPHVSLDAANPLTSLDSWQISLPSEYGAAGYGLFVELRGTF